MAIQDVFELSDLNNHCNMGYVNKFDLFKKANLRWKLFKRQPIFKGIPYIQYKRPSSTHWVEHQCTALNSHINNLPIFVGFCNNQILNAHNPQIKKIVPKLQGYKNDICVTKRVVFEAIKFDVLRLEPVTKMLQETLFCHPNFYLFLEMELKFWKSFIS